MPSETEVVGIVTFVGYIAIAAATLIGRPIWGIYRRIQRRNDDCENPSLQISDCDNTKDPRVELGHTLRARAYECLALSKGGILWNFLQIFVTLLASYAYVHEIYLYPRVPSVFFGLEWVTVTLIFTDLLIWWFVSYDKVMYLFNIFPFIDWITCVPFWITFAYGNVYAVTPFGVFFIRSLRFLRAVRLIRTHNLIPRREGSDIIFYRVTQFAIKLIVLWYTCACAIQFIETTCDTVPDETRILDFQWHTSLYFTTVSLTTTGYGDIAPRTDPGRGVIIFFLVTSVSVIPYYIGTIITLIQTINPYDRSKYSGSAEHILILGNLRAHPLRLFLSQWLHEESGNQHTHVVLVSDAYPDEDMDRVINVR